MTCTAVDMDLMMGVKKSQLEYFCGQLISGTFEQYSIPPPGKPRLDANSVEFPWWLWSPV